MNSSAAIADRLFRDRHWRRPRTLPLLSYYSEGVFQKYGEMFRELRQLKGG
jgi:hypothetical protein